MFTEPDFTPTPPSTEQDDQELEATSNVIQALDLLDIPLQTAEESFEFPDEEEKVDESCGGGELDYVREMQVRDVAASTAAREIGPIKAGTASQQGDIRPPRPSVFHVWSLRYKTWMESRSLCAMFSAHSAENLSKDRLKKIIENHRKEVTASAEHDESPSAERVGPGYYIVNVWREEDRDDITQALKSVTFQFYIGEVFKMTTEAGKSLVFAVPFNKLPKGLTVGVRWLTPIIAPGASTFSALRYRIAPNLDFNIVQGKDILGTVVFDRSKDDDRSVLWLTEGSLERCQAFAKAYELQWRAQNEAIDEPVVIEAIERRKRSCDSGESGGGVGVNTRSRPQNSAKYTIIRFYLHQLHIFQTHF